MAKKDRSGWTEVEVGEDDVTQTVQGLKSWKNSGPFLGKLSFLTEEGEVPQFQLHKCKYVLSKEYTLTGYVAGPQRQGIIQVNGRDLVSLEAEAIGTVLDINFSGFSLRKMLPKPDAILELLVPKKGQESAVKYMGYRIDSFLPGLKEYIQYKKEQLWLPGHDGYIAGGLAYCLNQELLNKVEYNWADFKSEQLRSALNCLSRGKKDHMFNQIKSFLEKYVSAAVPVLRQALRPGGVLGDAAARRSSMRASAKQSKQQGHTKLETPSRRSTRNKLKYCSTPQPLLQQAEGEKSGQNSGPRKKHKGKDNMDYGAAEAQHKEDMDTVIMKLRNAEQESKETSQKCVEGLSAGMMEMAESSAWLRFLFSSKYNKLKADNKALRAELRRLRESGQDL